MAKWFMTRFVGQSDTNEKQYLPSRIVTKSRYWLALPAVHYRWISRFLNWLSDQFDRIGLFRFPGMKWARNQNSQHISESAMRAMIGIEEIGDLSRYAVNKYSTTLEKAEKLTQSVDRSTVDYSSSIPSLYQLTWEYQQALLSIMDDTGRQITNALWLGESPSHLAAEGRNRINRRSEAYLDMCKAISQRRS